MNLRIGDTVTIVSVNGRFTVTDILNSSIIVVPEGLQSPSMSVWHGALTLVDPPGITINSADGHDSLCINVMPEFNKAIIGVYRTAHDDNAAVSMQISREQITELVDGLTRVAGFLDR